MKCFLHQAEGLSQHNSTMFKSSVSVPINVIDVSITLIGTETELLNIVELG